MDFGFAPGADSHRINLRTLFGRRSNTTLIDNPRIAAMRPFIAHLDGTRTIVKPIDDIVLGMHANNEGQISLPMFPGQTGWTTFETLEATQATASRSIKIPDSLIGFTAGAAATHFVHVGGCNIGRAPKFLRKLKEALGDHVRLSAPNFFHGITPSAEGSIEYMGYEFTIKRTAPFANRADALAAFDQAQFALIDGTVVPKADWEPLIPRNPNQEQRTQVTARLGVTLGKRTTLLVPRQYRVMPIAFGPWTLTYPKAADVPKDPFDQLLDLKINLKTNRSFQDTHPFPQYEREGFATLDEFISGYTWNCQRRGATLVCVGQRLLFVIVIAVTDPKTTPTGKAFFDGTLVFNFYPAAGSSIPARTTALTVTNPTFFTTV